MTLSSDGANLFMISKKLITNKNLIIWFETLNGASTFKSVPIEYTLYDILFRGSDLILGGGYLN